MGSHGCSGCWGPTVSSGRGECGSLTWAVAPAFPGSSGEKDLFIFLILFSWQGEGGFKSEPPLRTDQGETSLNTSLRSPSFSLPLPLPSRSHAPKWLCVGVEGRGVFWVGTGD